MVQNYIRGGQTTMHFYRMFAQINHKVCIVALIGYLLMATFWIASATTPYGRDIVLHYYFAKLHRVISGDHALYRFKDSDGRAVTLRVGHFVHHPMVHHYLTRTLAAIQTALIHSGLYTVLGVALFIGLLTGIGRLQTRGQEVRGSLFLPWQTLRKQLKKRGKASDIAIAHMPLVMNSETQHILLTGTTGTGKTLYLLELMDNIRRRKERAIVYDIAGAFIQHFYRPKRDIILDPFDMDCPIWNVWQDGQDLADFEAMAASLMPTHLSGHDPFWIHSARTIFATLAQQLSHTPHPKTRALLQPMFSGNLHALSQLLKGTPAETLVSPSVEKMALSIQSTLSTYCKSLLYLKEEGERPLFSIRRWVREETSDSWIFIATNAEKMEALKPLISVWLDTAARSILTLIPSYERRLWLLIDELASLHRLPSLSLLLSQGRKYGLCAACAFQDLHQIRTLYGRDEAEALFAMYNTNVFFRTKCPDTAAWMSQVTGQRERLEPREGFSYGANDVRDGVSIQQERHKEPLILETEFQKLEDCQAYLVLPGNHPVTQITLTPKKRKRILRTAAGKQRAPSRPEPSLPKPPSADEKTLTPQPVAPLLPKKTQKLTQKATLKRGSKTELLK